MSVALPAIAGHPRTRIQDVTALSEIRSAYFFPAELEETILHLLGR